MIATGNTPISGPRDPWAVSVAFNAVAKCKRGATAKVIAKRLGWEAVYTSQRLGKLYFYGLIDRVPDPKRTAAGREYRYQIKKWPTHA